MGKIERITVAVSGEMAARLRAVVEAGEYATEGEAVREALQDWGVAQDRRQAALARLREMIAEAENGQFIDGDQFFDELEAELRQMIRDQEAEG
jgi:antitoxin ParD1/3/4